VAPLNRSDRRKFLHAAAAASLSLPSESAWPVDRADPHQRKNPGRRPNILVAVSDDQSWMHTGAAGDRLVKTPVFDRVARLGVRFTHAFCCSPSCTPSRGAILTGQEIWRLEEGANLFSTLDKRFDVYPDLLEAAGYQVGYTGKGWGPGLIEPGGRKRNPAGPAYPDFRQFLDSVPGRKPFCFWFGGTDPHRPYVPGSGSRPGMKIEDVKVPPFLPDVPEVRNDLLDYYFAIERFDRQVGELLRLVEKAGELENTLVILTSDNGMPFPRAKCNLYDYGTRMPLAICWPGRTRGGRVIDDFIGFTDLAPTILETAGLKPPPAMTGRSFLDLLTSSHTAAQAPRRDRVCMGRERHSVARAGGAGYPMRAIRTRGFLYIHNLAPDRWPAGDGPGYFDIDPSPTKHFIIRNRLGECRGFFRMAFKKRPAEELYDLAKDPDQLSNLAGRSEYSGVQENLRSELHRQLILTGDPRAQGREALWDSYPLRVPKRA
jgi:uncharacterized sulfatase